MKTRSVPHKVTAPQFNIVPKLTVRLQRFHRQLSDYFNLQTKSWSRRQQQWFWGGWVGLGLSTSIAVTCQSFHTRKNTQHSNPAATGFINHLKPINRLPSFSHPISWERVLAYQWRLDSFRRLDTLTIKPVVIP